MLKHLPENSLLTLFYIFNTIWTTGNFLESWRLATVIPIQKPGKVHAEPTNYRPIALTSCLCKTLERMINKRLIWYLESNNLISPIQSGFRSERSRGGRVVQWCWVNFQYWGVLQFGGWSGGAKVLGKLSVPGRPTSLDDSRTRACCACSRCGWGLFGHFFLSSIFSVFFLPLFGRWPDID